MKLGIEEITKTIEDCERIGYNVKMGDIAYAILAKNFKDITIPYTILFGKESSMSAIKKYDSNGNMKFLKKYIDSNFGNEDGSTKDNAEKKNSEELSFGENKEQLIKNLDIIKKMKERGELDAKEFIKLDIEIRTKLVDKFQVSEKQDEQKIITLITYDKVCPFCHHEVRSEPAEEAIREIKEKYDLVPKQKTEEDIYE